MLRFTLGPIVPRLRRFRLLPCSVLKSPRTIPRRGLDDLPFVLGLFLDLDDIILREIVRIPRAIGRRTVQLMKLVALTEPRHPPPLVLGPCSRP